MKTSLRILSVAIVSLIVGFAPFAATASHYEAPSRSLEIITTTDYDTYEEGEDIEIKVTTKNLSSRSVTLRFNSGCQASYYILDDWNRIAYDSADDRMCTQALTSVTIPGKSSKSWTFTHRDLDEELDNGWYRIVGNVIGYGSDGTDIEIEEGENEDNGITVTSPNGGESWKQNAKKTIEWEFEDGDELGLEVDVRLYPTSAYQHQQPYSIVRNYEGDSYRWKVGKVRDYGRNVPKGTYKIEVCFAGTNDCGVSDSNFRIM